MEHIKKFTATAIFCTMAAIFCYKEHIENDLQSIFYVFGVLFFIHAIFVMYAFYFKYIDNN